MRGPDAARAQPKSGPRLFGRSYVAVFSPDDGFCLLSAFVFLAVCQPTRRIKVREANRRSSQRVGEVLSNYRSLSIRFCLRHATRRGARAILIYVIARPLVGRTCKQTALPWMWTCAHNGPHFRTRGTEPQLPAHVR